MNDNNFTAVAMCPSCRKVDIHPLRIAKTKANTNIVKNVDGVNIERWGGFTDPRWAVVIRQCACGKEWGQQ